MSGLPLATELFSPKQPFHQSMPNTNMMIIAPATTIATITPTAMPLLLFANGGGGTKSGSLYIRALN